MGKLKIGIIGCGNISNVHGDSLKELCGEFDAEVVAFADILTDRLADMAKRFPGAVQYDSGMKLISAEKLDIVHICLPTYLHAEHAVAAMEHGMNVFMEKPVCLKRSEAKRLLEVQRKTGSKVMIGQVVRFFDEYIYLKELYDTKQYGELKYLVLQRMMGGARDSKSISWFREPDKSGTVILDVHIHDVDFMRSLLGEPIDINVVTDMGGSDNQPMHIAAVYRYNDMFAFIEGGWGNAKPYRFRMSYRANFEHATVVYDSWENPSVIVYHSNGEVTKPQMSGKGPYYEEIRYFMECVIDGKPVEKASLEDAVKSFELTMGELEMAYKQAGVVFPIVE
jgi:predicted dehydrogenase